MPIVLDASLTASWFIPDEHSAETMAVFWSVEKDAVIVPAIWPVELANTMAMAIKRGRMTKQKWHEAKRMLSEFSVEVDAASIYSAWHEANEVAEKYNLTHYDATYLEIAMRRKISLATLDAALRAAAKKAKVRVLPK
jgi:predicted nucleic acid-binding protein